MCILFFAIKQHPKYPVIICANRDEFHQRPTQVMHWWSSDDNKNTILAGKDLQAGGTWLGLTSQGRFSALTNFRQPHLIDNTKQSRGELVLQALAKQDDDMAMQLQNSASVYNGFNLVFGSLTQLSCFDSVSGKLQRLTSGFHSLCNGALDDIWPKMALGQEKLADAIRGFPEQDVKIDELFRLMQNSQQADLDKLPQTGVPVDLEQLLSSIFIVSASYGTRTTNIITLDNSGHICVHDRSYNEKGLCVNQQTFKLPSAN